MNKKVVIMGSTGSIGTQTIDVIQKINQLSTENIKVLALSTYANLELIVEQTISCCPEYLHIADANTFQTARSIPALNHCRLVTGNDGWQEILDLKPDIVVHSIFGRSGLQPLLMALDRGIDIAFAGKEALVCGGPMVIQSAKKSGAKLLPIDSEHNSIFRCLQRIDRSEINRLILTASGGPLRNACMEIKQTISATEAARHPTWDMGAKISINSATLVNKGLEIVEATYLFDLPIDKVEVILHPQSIIHGMVQLLDGSILMHAANTDMRVPIAFCLAYPKTLDLFPPLTLTPNCSLEFSQVDSIAFPAVQLFQSAARMSWIAPAILNLANELWLDEFIAGKLSGIMGCFRSLEYALHIAHNYSSTIPTLENWFVVEQEVIKQLKSNA